MAETTHEVLTQTVKQPQFTTNETTLCCESCVVVKEQLIQVFEELKSTRTIIALLQEDIVKLNANHESKSLYREQSLAQDQVSKNWRMEMQYGYKKYKKPVVPNRQLITLTNRFTPLSDKQGSTAINEATTHDKEKTGKSYVKYNKKPSKRLSNKVLILGDSHARNCSQGVKHNLNHNTEVQGIVKPGADMETIVGTSIKSVKKLTKKDTVVVWGGTRDIGKNEAAKGLHQLKNFVEQNNQTNFIVIGAPHRYDLDLKSCVNEEVKVYNRELKECLKTCENIEILEIDSNRDLFTRHGLHLNSKGKDQIAEKIAQIIKVRLNGKINEPNTLKDSEVRRVENIQTGVKEVQLIHEDQIGSIPDQEENNGVKEVHLIHEDQIGSIPDQEEINGVKEAQLTHEDQNGSIPDQEENKGVKEVQLIHEDQIDSIPDQEESNGVREVQLIHKDQSGSIPDQEENKLPHKRIRKPPNTRYDDFLWMDRKINQM